MKWGNRIIFLILLLISFVGLYYSFKYGIGTLAKPGPGFFPLISVLAMAFFSLILLFVFSSEEKNPWSGLRWKRIIFVSAVMLFYGLFIEKLGFMLCNFIAVASLLYTIDTPKWYFSLSGSFLLAFTFDFVFRVLLGIPLPIGPFKIL